MGAGREGFEELEELSGADFDQVRVDQQEEFESLGMGNTLHQYQAQGILDEN